MNVSLDPIFGIGILLIILPLVYLLGALLPAGRNWSAATAAAGLAPMAALIAAMGLAFGGPAAGGEVIRLLTLLPLGNLGTLDLSVRLDVLTCVMLGLVGFIGFIILRFSRRYLDGEPGEARYVRWFMGTLAAVTLLIVTNSLLVLALAWICTSLALHKLLIFYPDRPQALIAAHKKFIASRVADLCMLGAVFLIGASCATLEMDQVFTAVRAMPELPASLQTAAILLVAAAALKCAQLPFHGWLIQVMEAPTPVSALLHAGVVNIGGFLMIRMAPLMIEAGVAQMLLVVCGSLTAVTAALVMTTRVSIKVALAWSTCAQMGFMLLECGLGAYSLALLHLVAHSCYKAHAFLSAGSVVETWRAARIAPAAAAPTLTAWGGAVVVSLLAVVAVGWGSGIDAGAEPALWLLTGIVGVALTPLVLRSVGGGMRRFAAVFVAAAGVSGLYFAWHAAFSGLLHAPRFDGGLLAASIGIAALAFAVLFALYAIISARPHGTMAQKLYPRLYAGLYLDELFTRLTFRVLPARIPDPSPSARAVAALEREA